MISTLHVFMELVLWCIIFLEQVLATKTKIQKKDMKEERKYKGLKERKKDENLEWNNDREIDESKEVKIQRKAKKVTDFE
ncbi:Uncharacterized protein DAT39_018132, partial [Clarias magur]